MDGCLCVMNSFIQFLQSPSALVKTDVLCSSTPIGVISGCKRGVICPEDEDHFHRMFQFHFLAV